MSKKPTAGSEVDSYCTKCKLDLNHRIVAMEGTKIKRVECLTCKGQHNYRIPKSAKPAKPAPRKRATRTSTASKTAAAKKAAIDEQQQAWEAAIMGKTAADFTAYRMSEDFSVGQLVRHKKFGDGVVEEVKEGQKIVVVFEPGPKILIHQRP